MNSEFNKEPDFDFIGVFERKVDLQRRIIIPKQLISSYFGRAPIRKIFVIPTYDKKSISFFGYHISQISDHINNRTKNIELLNEIITSPSANYCSEVGVTESRRITIPEYHFRYLGYPERVRIIGMGIFFELEAI